VQAFSKGDGKEMGPKAYLNSDLNEFKLISRIEINIQEMS